MMIMCQGKPGFLEIFCIDYAGNPVIIVGNQEGIWQTLDLDGKIHDKSDFYMHALIKQSMMKKNRAIHYHVYVILLEDKVKNIKKVKVLNPGRDVKKPCIYVGMTGLDPGARLINHLTGYKASRFAKKYGIRLMPELYEGLNPLTYDEAVIAEAGLARRLRAEGYTVVGGH